MMPNIIKRYISWLVNRNALGIKRTVNKLRLVKPDCPLN